MRGRTFVALAIAAFLLRGAFYCVVQPLWEGFDEWAHFGYVEHLACVGRLPSRSDPVSNRLRRSVELAPLSASAAAYATTAVTHDAFWRLPAEERRRREGELRGRISVDAKPGAVELFQYEAQQPPLYYAILVLPYWVVRNASLPVQALTLRLASLLIAAAGLLLCYKLARSVPACRSAAIPVLLLLASWPGLMLGVARIGNDGLAMVLGAAVVLCSVRIVRREPAFRDWILQGVLLGAAVLAKAYMLALLPLLPFAALIQSLRRKSGRLRAGSGCLLALALVGLMAGWWYVPTWLATGTLSGEQLDVAAARFGLAARLAAIRDIKWLRVLDSAATTHIWIGGWSFLQVRSWMYRVFEFAALLSAAGLAVLVCRFLRRAHGGNLRIGDLQFSVVACAQLLFCFGIAYFAMVVYLASGMSTALGWHLYGIAGAEILLLGCGFTGLFGVRRAAACLAAMALLASALDLYTVHFVLIPYYSGLTAHLPSGHLAAFRPSSLGSIGLYGVLERLAFNKPQFAGAHFIAGLWLVYLFATAALIALSVAVAGGSFNRASAARLRRQVARAGGKQQRQRSGSAGKEGDVG